MKVNLNKRMVQVLVVAACLNFTSCVKDGGVTPRVVVGEWELKTADNQAPDERTTWDFDEDGDFKMCIGGDCYFGEWEWNNDKTELDIDFVDDWGDEYFTEFEVDVLDKEDLEGIWSIDGERYAMEFERDE